MNQKTVHNMDDYGQPHTPAAKVMPALYLHMNTPQNDRMQFIPWASGFEYGSSIPLVTKTVVTKVHMLKRRRRGVVRALSTDGFSARREGHTFRAGTN